MLSIESIQKIKELLRRDYNRVEEEIQNLKDLIKKKRKLKDSTPSRGETLECWKQISKWSNRLESLKKRRKSLQRLLKEIKCEL